MNESDIQSFWDSHPCGESLSGEITKFRDNFENFFSDYDAYRYNTEGHILECLDRINFKGMKTLEIGLGQGADSEQIIRRGALWSGIDLTPESVARVRARLDLRKLSFERIEQGSVLELPFPDNSFDVVYSHGVLHHVPDIGEAQREIHRVLRPKGRLVVMLYAKWSLNYLLAILLVRRLALVFLYGCRIDLGGISRQHIINAKKLGLFKYLQIDNFIHRNTDGPLNPYAKVYDLKEVEKDFSRFSVLSAEKRFMHAPPLPVRWLPLERLLGWHLWVHLKPRSGNPS